MRSLRLAALTIGLVLLASGLPAVAREGEVEAAASVVATFTSGGGAFSAPESVHVAPSGDVYVVDTGNNRVVRLDASGTHLDTIGAPGSGNGQFNHPYQAAVDGAGNLYVADGFNNRIQKFDGDGDFVATRSLGANKIPTGIAVANGEVFVANTTDSRILVFADDLNGPSSRTIGTFGTGNGQLQGPRNLDIAGPLLYVADQFNRRVVVFNASTGAFIRKWGRFGNTAGRFDTPIGVAADGMGNVYVGDSFNGRVQRFTTTGKYVEEFKGLNLPGGVDTAADGRVHVANTLANQVRVYQRGDGVLVDARIRRGAAAVVGNDLYGTDGVGQIAVGQTVRGGTVTYSLSFQNDGLQPDRIRIGAQRPARHFKVIYRQGNANRTTAVHAGSLQTPVLAPGQVYTLTARVTMKRTAPRFAGQARLVTATSVNRSGVRDAVKMGTQGR